MSEMTLNKELEQKISERAQILFAEQQRSVYVRTDAMFGMLLVLEWVAGIIVALTVSPRVWAGSQSDVHLHVWCAVVLGALIISLPVYMALRRPGEVLTRHAIAIAQMLYSALLIHLSGGRIETHFHIFGSLAFLGFYRDWRVLISASAVAMLDHILRGVYFPQSVYGISGVEPYRWFEHTCWVVFEDLFLILACIENVKEMHAVASRRAEAEETRDKIEELVDERTAALAASEKRLATQYAVTSYLNGANTFEDAAAKILEAIARGLLPNQGAVVGMMWTAGENGSPLQNICQLHFSRNKEEAPSQLSASNIARLSFPALAEKVRASGKFTELENLEEMITLTSPQSGEDEVMRSAFVLPFFIDGNVCGVIEFFAESKINLDAREVSMLASLAHQLSNFAGKMQVEAVNRRLANMVEWSGEAIIGTTLDGTITSWNRGAQSCFGFVTEEATGKNISIICPESKAGELEHLQSLNRRGQTVEGFETERINRDGKLLDVSVTRSPVFDDYGRITGISVVMHDITERKIADRRVSEFYSIVSHELRTPLTSVRGVLGLIEGGIVEAGSAEAAGLMSVARESTDRLIRLINDMLDLKKIESGKMVLQCRLNPVEKLVTVCLDGLKGMAETSAVKLQPDLHYRGSVFADTDKATQVLTNLVSNAIKFSPEGSEIIVSVKETYEGTVRFNVIDNGPGIDAENQAKLFEKFQQIDSSDTRKQGGTGLGLAICKALVQEHKGKIGLESIPGKGSTFWFELPREQTLNGHSGSDQPGNGKNGARAATKFAQTNAAKTGDKNGTALPNKGILLVEDDADLARVLTVHFKHSGYGTVVAGSLEEARKHLASATFNVVVLDLTLPDGNGLDLLEEIKAEESTADLPVIVITGQSIDDKEMEHPEVSDWLAKPFHSSELIEVIDRLTAERNMRAVVLTNRDERALQDLGMQLKALGLQYMKEGGNLETAVKRRENRPDLVILDLTVAESNTLAGLKMLEHKTGVVQGNFFPLVIYSRRGSDDNEDLESNGITEGSPNGETEESQSDLINAVSALINGICQ